VNRPNCFSVHGGDTVQMLETKNELEELGVNVDIYLGDNKYIEYNKYDLVHIFNIQTDKFSLKQVKKFKKKNKKIIVSPIWWDFEISNIDNEQYFSKKAIYFSKIFGKNIVILLKKINLKIRYNRMKKILKHADSILPNSQSEAELIIDNFGIEKDKINVIYNGIGKVFERYNFINAERNYVLQVGRIELQKNTHLTIRACKELNIPLVLVGKIVDNEYYKLCLEEGENSELTIFNNKNHEELIEIYRKAKIHILPSMRETPGLVSLEAASQGCVIVSTDIGSAKDYFGETGAIYCNPYEYESVRSAINYAWNFKNQNKNYSFDITKFKWKNAAKDTLEQYNALI